jgi:acetyl esterase/lipase
MTRPIGSAENTEAGLLTPEAAALLNGIRANGFQGWAALGLEQSRAAILQLKDLAGPAQPIRRLERIPLPNTDALLYLPESSVPVPVLLYMHGGGWVLGDASLVDSLVRTLTNGSGCAVLSVNYRLAPEHKYPAALEDVISAIDWVAVHGRRFGLDGQRIAVGGDSSGANLAAAACLMCRDREGPRVSFQLLVYPPLGLEYASDSYTAFGDGTQSALSRADIAWFRNQYLNRPEEIELPYVCPLRAETFKRLPPALIICAEVDPLVDENRAYAEKLEQAGIPVELKIFPGMFHGFWRMGGVLAEAGKAIHYAADRLAAVMAA